MQYSFLLVPLLSSLSAFSMYLIAAVSAVYKSNSLLQRLKAVATAVKDASNWRTQECDRIFVMSRWQTQVHLVEKTCRWHRLCLIPGEKPSDYHCFNQMVHEYIDAQKLSL